MYYTLRKKGTLGFYIEPFGSSDCIKEPYTKYIYPVKTKNLEGSIPLQSVMGILEIKQQTKANPVTSNSEMTANIPSSFVLAVFH